MRKTSFLTAVTVSLVVACGGAPTAPTAPTTPTATTAAPPTPAAQTLRYTVVTAGRPSGAAELTIAADGTRTAHFTFNDRGRGPDITTTIELAPDGAPRRLRSTGNDYLKAPVDDQLEEKDGELTWRAKSEQGHAPRDGGFFVPLGGPFDANALLARALLRAPGRRIKLLPAGEAWIDDDSELTAKVAGAERRLRRLAIAGLGTSPFLIWLDEKGEYFAEVSAWFSTIAAGAEPLIPTLLAEDDRWRAARAGKLAAELTGEPPAAGLAFTHARLFDSDKRRIREDVTVVVAGDRIVAVGGARTKIPPGAQVIDARGRTLLPGLWDMHVHIGDDDGILHLVSGVTTVRDMGNHIEALTGRLERFDTGTEVGPRILRAGLIDGPGPLAAPTGVLAGDEDEARAAVKRFADLGYEQIKIYSSVKEKLVPVIVQAAHARVLRVSGHVPSDMIASEAVEAGFDEIQHANMLFLNFLLKPGDDSRGPARFTLVAARAAGLDLHSAPVSAFLDLLKRKKTVLDPTLGTFESMFNAEPTDMSKTFEPYAGRLPAQIERFTRGGGLEAAAGQRAIFRASHAAMGKLVELAWRRGIRIVAGTDSIAGLALQRELELYVAAGIPANEVLAIATLGAARVMGKDKVSGSIAVGKQADMFLVDGDPSKDIGSIRNVDLTVARGRIYDPAKLFPAVGMKARK